MVASRIAKQLECSSVILEGYTPLVCTDQPVQERKESILWKVTLGCNILYAIVHWN